MSDPASLTLTREQVASLDDFMRRSPDACCVRIYEFLADMHHLYLIHDHHVAPAHSAGLWANGRLFIKEETQR